MRYTHAVVYVGPRIEILECFPDLDAAEEARQIYVYEAAERGNEELGEYEVVDLPVGVYDHRGDYDESEDEPDHSEDDGMTDAEADADTLRSAGMGTDEDYGYFGGEY